MHIAFGLCALIDASWRKRERERERERENENVCVCVNEIEKF